MDAERSRVEGRVRRAFFVAREKRTHTCTLRTAAERRHSSARGTSSIQRDERGNAEAAKKSRGIGGGTKYSGAGSYIYATRNRPVAVSRSCNWRQRERGRL